MRPASFAAKGMVLDFEHLAGCHNRSGHRPSWVLQRLIVARVGGHLKLGKMLVLGISEPQNCALTQRFLKKVRFEAAPTRVLRHGVEGRV